MFRIVYGRDIDDFVELLKGYSKQTLDAIVDGGYSYISALKKRHMAREATMSNM